MSVTLSSERVREVASCCCSNVSIRLPQSGKVTLLPFATLKEIEAALKLQVKVKKEEMEGINSEGSYGDPGRMQLLIKQEQSRSFMDELYMDVEQKDLPSSKSPSLGLLHSSKQKPLKLGSAPSFGGFSTSSSIQSVFMPSVSASSNSSLPKLSKSQSHQMWSSSADQQVTGKKMPSSHQSTPHLMQHKQQTVIPRGEATTPLLFKASGTIKDSRTQTSSISSRKSKKDESESPWLNAPMFSDESSSSPFHTSIDCFDSDNSM